MNSLFASKANCPLKRIVNGTRRSVFQLSVAGGFGKGAQKKGSSPGASIPIEVKNVKL
jgi:hypothetical protein